jgi:opacity protein-like surface antigen
MFKNCLFVVGCSISLISASAFAQSISSAEHNGYYVDAAYALVDVKDTSTYNLGTWKPTLARIAIGKEVTENLAIEGFITQGINSDTVTLSGSDLKLKLNSGYGIAARPFIKATDEIELYGRIGWLQHKNTSSIASISYDYTFNQYFWSIGAAYKITDNLSAVIDYSKLQNKEEIDADISFTAIGLRYRF